MLSSFDYDDAVRQIRRKRAGNSASSVENSESMSQPSPQVYMVQSFCGLRILERSSPAGGGEQQQLRTGEDVTALLEKKYQMDEPNNADRENYDLWTSIMDTELFAIKEFPRLFWNSRNGGKYRFRKHYWGIMGYCPDTPLSAYSPEKIGPGFFPTVFKEMSALRTVGQHANITCLLDVFIVGSKPADFAAILVFENWGFTLREILSFPNAKRRMDANSIMRRLIFQQILKGLEFIHAKKIIHRNINAASVKMDSEGRVRLGAFNYAIPAGITVKAAPFPEEDFPVAYPDTYDHLAPEILLGSKQYETSSDIWSAGMVYVELHLHHSLYQADTFPDMLRETHHFSSLPVITNMFRVFGTPTDVGDFWKLPYFHSATPKWKNTLNERLVFLPFDAKNLAQKMLQYLHTARPSAETLLCMLSA